MAVKHIIGGLTGAVIAVGVFFLIQGAISDISLDSYTLNGSTIYNISQAQTIRSVDTGVALNYSMAGDKLFKISGDIKLNASQLSLMSSNDISVQKTYDGATSALVSVLPYVFVAILLIGAVGFMTTGGFEREPSYKTIKHPDDPVSNPKYEGVGPIRRNKNYDRIN